MVFLTIVEGVVNEGNCHWSFNKANFIPLEIRITNKFNKSVVLNGHTHNKHSLT